jgi:hypothetical protein
VICPVFFESLNGFSPVQFPPEAVQEVALVLDQVMRDRSPIVTVIGLAEMLTVGAGVACALAIDPVAIQASATSHRAVWSKAEYVCITRLT